VDGVTFGEGPYHLRPLFDAVCAVAASNDARGALRREREADLRQDPGRTVTSWRIGVT
jgi:hypothetical protein